MYATRPGRALDDERDYRLLLLGSPAARYTDRLQASFAVTQAESEDAFAAVTAALSHPHTAHLVIAADPQHVLEETSMCCSKY